MSQVLQDAALPRCGRCLQKVQKGEFEAILDDQYRERGVRITYSCHGLTESYDVTAVHFELYGGVPFVETAFVVATQAAPAVDIGMSIASKVTNQIRETRLKCATFVESKIREFVASQLDFDGDVAGWCARHNLRLEQYFASLCDHSATVLELKIEKRRVVGQFILPFHPDASDFKWILTSST